MQLLDRVRATIQRHDLARPDSRIVVALSGGPDSVALAHLLRSLDSGEAGCVVGLAHFDHRLRDGSADDVRFCRDVAATCRLPVVVESGDVRARARRDHQSLEAAAHAARYEFLIRAATELGADRIALGHTRDDQAETFLLRLLRGAGPRGLAGMHPRHGPFIRPLIDCRRRDLRAYLDAAGQPCLHDPTNDDVRIPRNRVRADLIPLLERRFNPRIVDVLADEADIAREDWAWLDVEAQRLLDAARRDGDVGVSVIDAEVLSRAPTAVTRAALLRVLEQAAAGRPIRQRHVTAALDIVRSPRGGVDLPGFRLKRLGRDLVLSSSLPAGRREARTPAPTSVFRYSLSVPGEVRVPEAECTITAEPQPFSADVTQHFSDRQATVIPLDSSNRQLIVRNRRPGDRFQPLGLNGRKKLQDYFVDRKVPRSVRDHVPLVVDEHNRIVWVAGHVVAADFRVTSPVQAVIILRLTPWGGPS
jgi:tRNA(Ile)-lysidine synthase